MKQNTKRLGKVKREGIALIAVLGFLSILVLMAVAFLMNMRTERLVAEAAKDDVRTRQLVRSALATAMDDVDDLMNNYDLATGNPAGIKPQNIHVTPAWAIIPSTRPPYTDDLGSSVQLISGKVTDWLPRKYLSSADVNFNASNKAASADWIYISDPAPIAGKPARILGRCAYLAFDCTGMMDANLTDFPVTRGAGTNIAEVSIEFLPEVGGTLESQYLFNNRTNYALFGTFPEILFLNDGDPKGSVYPEKPALGLSLVNNLIPYSLCYDNGWWDWANSTWNMPGNIQSWTTAADAEAAFTNAGFTVAEAQEMGQCFVDYTDEDFIPQSMFIPCCEPVPMINEIIGRARLELNGLDLTYTIFIDLELWYPFRSNPGQPNDNQHDYQVGIAPPPTLAFDITAAAGSSTFTLNPPGSPPLTAALNPSKPTTPFLVTQSPLQYVFTYTFPAAPTFPIQVRCKSIKGFHVTATDLTASGTPVSDDVDLKQNPYMQISLLRLDGAGFVESLDPVSLAVLDPRLNHLPSVNGAANWNNATTTKGAANYAKTPGGFLYSTSGDYEGPNMYVRNSPNLDSVAELGYIPTTNRWSTVDLFSPAGRTLLSKYRIYNLVAKTYTNGLINPNSLYTNVLIAAFRGAPIEDFPGDTAAGSVDAAMANDIAIGMYADITNSLMFGSNSYDSAAGWVTSRAFVPTGTLMRAGYLIPPYNMDNNKKESIIRNSYQLFNPNQQMFTIVVVAQTINDQGTVGTFDGEDVDTVSGEKRAVALVWRDPFPGPSGRHETFVKLFKYLDE